MRAAVALVALFWRASADEDEACDWTAYARENADLAAVYGNDAAALRRHYAVRGPSGIEAHWSRHRYGLGDDDASMPNAAKIIEDGLRLRRVRSRMPNAAKIHRKKGGRFAEAGRARQRRTKTDVVSPRPVGQCRRRTKTDFVSR